MALPSILSQRTVSSLSRHAATKTNILPAIATATMSTMAGQTALSRIRNFNGNNSTNRSSSASTAAAVPSPNGPNRNNRFFATATADSAAGHNAYDHSKATDNSGGSGKGSAESSNTDKSTDGSKEEGKEEDQKPKHEYDTQSKEKRIGNPIAWANPLSGPTMEDQSNPKWGKVYPIGFALICFGALWSRRKNLKREREEAVVEQSSVNMGAMGGRFSAPPGSY